VPIVLLIGVVGAGALGPRQTASEPTAAPAGSPEAGREPTPTPARTPTPLDAAGDPVAFPETWIGFRVRSVGETLDARDAGEATGIVAVSGFLDYDTLPWTCTDAFLETEPGACTGRALLADLALPDAPSDAVRYMAIGRHLHPAFGAGVRGPAPDDRPGGSRAEPIPVVLFGSFDTTGPACADGRFRCDQTFRVARVVWVAGAPWGPTLTIDPALGVEPGIPEIRDSVGDATAALGVGALPLVTAVVLPETLGLLDAAAANALPPIPEAARQRPVTYVRGLVFELDASQPLYGRDPRVEWVVLDSIEGRELARS
jgi:hypothetical protein